MSPGIDPVPEGVGELDEVKDAQTEMEEVRIGTERAVEAALASGRAVKVDGVWSHDGVSTSALAAAKVQVEAFPRVSDEGTKLAEQAALVIGLREALLTCDWAQAASWAGLVHLLDGIEGEGAALDEVSAAWQEVADKRAAASMQKSTDKIC